MTVKQTRTMCTTCHARCGVIVHSDVEENRIIKIEGDVDNPKSHGVLCAAGMSEREIHNNLEGRILYPMKRVGERGSGKWERITWDEAMDTIESTCKRLIEEYGPESIITAQGTGRTWNHWHCRLNSSLGLEGWSLVPTHVCLMPHIVPNAFTLGIGSPADGDIKNCNTVVFWGYNPNKARPWTTDVYDVQNRGGNLIVIDSRFHDIAKHADLFIGVRPGTDAALAMGIMREIVKQGWFDQDWIDKWTYGFDELVERIEEWTPEHTGEVCEIDPDCVRVAARMMAEEGPTAMRIGVGPGCMHSNAIQNGRAVACLQGLLGYLDVPGGIPISVAFSVMMDPKITLWDESKDPGRPDLFTFGGEEHSLYKSFGRSNDPHATFEAIITGEPRPVKAFIAIANDPLLCYENTHLTHEALTSPNLELIVFKDFYVSPSAQYADIILPSADWSERCTYDEEMDRDWLFVFDKAVDPPGECWDDWKFFLEWGKRMRPEDWPWKDEKEMVLWRFKTFYDFDMTWEEFQSKPVRAGSDAADPASAKSKKYELGLLRPDGQPGFATPTGRIEFYCAALAAFGYDPLPEFIEPAESKYSRPDIAEEYPLCLGTGHRVYSFFHSAWTNIPMQRQFYPDPFAVVHPDDAKAYGVTDGEWMTISSPRGKIISKCKVSRETKKGVVSVPRPGWRDACPELGLPGYGWDKANENILVPSEPADPGFGATPMRSTLCKIEPGRGDL